MYDIIALENLRLFSSSAHKREAGAIENLHSGGTPLKRYVFGDPFHRIRVGGRTNRRKKIKRTRNIR